jgi:type I restriction enzyme S subunit
MDVTNKSKWNTVPLGEILPLSYGKARSEQFGYRRPNTATFGSNGCFGTFDRALTSKPALIVGRKGAAGSVHFSTEPCWPIDTAFYTEGSDELSLPFFRYLLESLQLAQHDRSTAIPSLSRDDYNSKLISFPGKKQEQDRIVAEIEKQFTRLDAGIAALRDVQAKLKRYRAAVLKAACEGKLVPTEAELARKEARPYETGEQLLQRILAERRKIHEQRQKPAARKTKYKDPTPSIIPTDEELPKGWTWASWEQIGISQNGRPFQSSEYQPRGFKLLRPGNLHVSGKVIWTEDNTRRVPEVRADENPDLIVRGGELVMNLTAQSLKDEFLGRVCVTSSDEECLLNQRLARLTPILVLPLFALYLLKAGRFRSFVDGLNSGSLIQHMFTSQLAEFTFPLPPLAEQKRIVAEVERRLSVVEELEAVISANLQRASRLRQSILQKAFTGGLQ